VSDQVDLIVVHDHKLAEQIVKALKHAGIQHVEFWPEDILDPSIGIAGRGRMEPVFRRRAHAPQGPFHICVPGEWYHDAHVALMKSGLTES
jgi:hypothetical protein